ncbi:MAG: hypothetical protein ABEJ89_07285 [Haloarculaceae archaeon]
MFDRVTDISSTLRSGNAAPEGDPDDALFDALLGDGEQPRHVLVSDSGIEHTTDGRTTTVQPGEDHAAYAVVTGQRLLFLLGDDPETAEVDLALGSLSRVKLSEGLLQQTVVVTTGDETVRFEPDGGHDPETVVDYVDRLSNAWADLQSAVAGVREALADLENALEAGEDPQNELTRVKTRLSNAHHCATMEDDGPTDLMAAEIEPLEAELERLQVGSRLDRAADLLAAAGEAREDGDDEAAYERYLEADSVLEEAAAALGDRDAPGDAGDRLATLREDAAALGEDLLAEPEINCQRALEADAVEEAADCWASAYEAYRAALSAGWDGRAGVTADALRYQLAWVVANYLDALAAHADAIETEADDLADDAEERYADARARLERARTIAAEYPYASAARFEGDIERVEEKRERAEWQWGTAD